MSFFIPFTHSNATTNEFGPAIYVTDDFDYAKAYAGTNGAILVFDDLHVHDLNIWRPTTDEWRSLTAHWSRFSMKDIMPPAGYNEVDAITSPISKMQKAMGHLPSELNQIALITYHGCECLASSLVAIIYIEN